MDEKEILTDVIDVDGKNFFLVDTVDSYIFYAEETNPENFLVLKEINDNGENYIVSLDDDHEFEKAVSLYYEKFRDVSI